jgi:hypothetical protein
LLFRVSRSASVASSWRAGAGDGRWAREHYAVPPSGASQTASPQLCGGKNRERENLARGSSPVAPTAQREGLLQVRRRPPARMLPEPTKLRPVALSVNPQGVITAFRLAPANCDEYPIGKLLGASDRHGAFLADKGFSSWSGSGDGWSCTVRWSQGPCRGPPGGCSRKRHAGVQTWQHSGASWEERGDHPRCRATVPRPHQPITAKNCRSG